MKVDFGPKKSFTIDTNSKIEAIKCIRKYLGTGLKEAKDLVEAETFLMPERLGQMLDLVLSKHMELVDMERGLTLDDDAPRTTPFAYVTEWKAQTIEVEV